MLLLGSGTTKLAFGKRGERTLKCLEHPHVLTATRTVASWNQIAAWLRQLDRLRATGYGALVPAIEISERLRMSPPSTRSGVTSRRSPQAARRRV